MDTPLREAQRQYILGWKLQNDLILEIDRKNLKYGTPEFDEVFDAAADTAKQIGEWARLGWFDFDDVNVGNLVEAWPDPKNKKFDN